jgi:hypothetical protein
MAGFFLYLIKASKLQSQLCTLYLHFAITFNWAQEVVHLNQNSWNEQILLKTFM